MAAAKARAKEKALAKKRALKQAKQTKLPKVKPVATTTSASEEKPKPRRIILPASTLATTPIVEVEEEAEQPEKQPIAKLVESSVAKPQPSNELAEILKRSAELEQERQIELARQAMLKKEAELAALRSSASTEAGVPTAVNSIVQTELAKAMTTLKQSWDAQRQK